ncbi:zinc-binding dehydrogenase [Actinosynnema sp. NPDC047251]|uniref:Alcohol dehydrogenase zinc-binding domain protein n=1 Tax=Saccharothrix espanaensis (strain ATCC 51144 / DSM 44229 / JCM 9112 / NBRC 15066 / NRRL 15764) TaxID=1179773 RepID=K0K909_SACES|nr:zinc-binding dehydrogenase [Saccharothrix espanaensis]CCH33329.1 Alcohol dehydrogenase zinc-binding domain protein [Saccharothrix espanaensis DSM 44229]
MIVRGAVLDAVGGPLRVRRLSLDPPGPGELLIRIGATGLCHSDLSVIDGSRVRPLPMVLGHEAAGEVVEVGGAAGRGGGAAGRGGGGTGRVAEPVGDLAERAGFVVGDRVVLSFVPACGGCRRCVAGRPALCEPGGAANREGTLLGGGRRWRDADGTRLNHHLGVSGFAEYAVVSEKSATRIPGDLPFDVAALFGCAVLTGVGAAFYSAGVVPGDRVAVFGLGGVGLAAVLGARAAGAASIIAVDVVQAKLDLAARLGAEVVLGGVDAGRSGVGVGGAGVVRAVRELTGGGADKVIDTTGVVAVLEQAYAATAPGGVTVAVGLPHPDKTVSLPALSLVAEERTLKGSYLGSCVPRRDVPRFVELYRAGLLPVRELLTGSVELDAVNDGFARLASGEAVRQVIVM